jgi:hypothetical protein
VHRLLIWIEDTEARSSRPAAFVQSPVRVGRNPRNDVVLARPFVSSAHGVIHFDEGGVRYSDLGSTNGSTVDGAPVEPRVPTSLRPGSEIRIGSMCLRVSPPDADAKGPEPSDEEAGEAPTRARLGGISQIMLELARDGSSPDGEDWCRLLLPGTAVGRFELVREIGRGGFGVVFEAKDRQLGRRVAFKAVRHGRFSQVRLRQDQLRREAEAIAQLSHPNIVQIFDVGRCESGPYLILELLRGRTLHERLREGPLSMRQALEVAIDVAWALEHAHAAGVIHRDLKPSNVFLCEGGRVKVLDFGIAHVFGEGLTRAVGTPAYMAPEQWREGPQDARTDVFGAAAMLLESVTGRLPYEVEPDWSAVLEEGAQPAVDGADLPPRLAALLRSALDPDPARRPAGGATWLEGLLAAQAELDPVREGGRTGARRLAVRVAWLAAIAASIAAAAWLAFHR